MSAPTDAWLVMALVLAGERPPPLPLLPGRVHRAPPSTDHDPWAALWDAQHQQTTDPERTS